MSVRSIAEKLSRPTRLRPPFRTTSVRVRIGLDCNCPPGVDRGKLRKRSDEERCFQDRAIGASTSFGLGSCLQLDITRVNEDRPPAVPARPIADRRREPSPPIARSGGPYDDGEEGWSGIAPATLPARLTMAPGEVTARFTAAAVFLNAEFTRRIEPSATQGRSARSILGLRLWMESHRLVQPGDSPN